jgi:hypothetical protein
VAPPGRARLYASATTPCSPCRSPILLACSGSPRRRAGASWRWLVSNLTSAMRGGGACGTASQGQSSWPAVCCRRPTPTSPSCCGPCVTPCRGLWWASGRTAHWPSAVPSRRCSPRCHPTWVPASRAASRRSPSMKPTARPRRPGHSVSVGYAPWNGVSQDGVQRKPQAGGATLRPGAGPSRPLAGHLGQPRGSPAPTASAR